MPAPLQRLQVSGLVPGGTPVPPENKQHQKEDLEHSIPHQTQV